MKTVAIQAKIVAVIFLVTSLANCSVPAQPDISIRKHEARVAKDTESRVLSLRNFRRPLADRGNQSAGIPENRLLCHPEDLPNVQILKPPSHGTVRLGKGQTKVRDCPNRLPAIVVFYKPDANFSGEDELIVSQMADYWSKGNDRQTIIAITVQ